MAKKDRPMGQNEGNLSHRFATMTEDERRRYELEFDRAREAVDKTVELEFDEPRKEPEGTKANLEDRDGVSALLDDEKHDRLVREQARRRNPDGRERP